MKARIVATRSDRSHPKAGTDDARDKRRDAGLEALRAILFDGYRERVADLERELEDVEHRITDEEALLATVTPVLGDAIRRRIRDAREEMIEALYPIIGQLVVRAVSEAIRDLARKIDAQVRTSFTPQVLWWRLRARIGGASSGELALREVLPFQVAQVFLIHRKTGLLLQHVFAAGEPVEDSDLIGSMLSAIRDFAEDAFGRGEQADLDVVEYGDRRILIEAGEHAYVAVVVDGVEPPGFRSEMRERIIEIGNTHASVLRDYDGDPTALSSAKESLGSLLVPTGPVGLSTMQKRLLAGAFTLLFACVILSCYAGRWAWKTFGRPPTPTAVPVIAEVTPSATPTQVPTPTYTATPLPTHTPTVTPSPTSTPLVGMMTGHVWMRGQPSSSAPLLGIIVRRGQSVTIRAVYGEWCQIEWVPEAGSQAVGWVPLEWVGTMGTIPEQVTTPTVGP
jgi:hypothetical protein